MSHLIWLDQERLNCIKYMYGYCRRSRRFINQFEPLLRVWTRQKNSLFCGL